MKNLEAMGDAQFLFGALLMVANRMDTLLERSLAKYNVTAKQWFLSIVLSSLFDEPPTIKELAKAMGSSHQNVKQVALKLQEKGLLSLEKDSKDARATRVRFTDRSLDFWDTTTDDGAAFMGAFFKGIGPETLAAARAALQKMNENLDDIDKAYSNSDFPNII